MGVYGRPLICPSLAEVKCRQDGQGILGRRRENCLGERGPGPPNVHREGSTGRSILPTEDSEVKAARG